jgi:ubiquinone/menaquinone biosynthesis C-methylase UbiE
MHGCDISQKLLEYAMKRNEKASLLVCDALNLPIRSQSFDAFLCVAVLHHLSN